MITLLLVASCGTGSAPEDEAAEYAQPRHEARAESAAPSPATPEQPPETAARPQRTVFVFEGEFVGGGQPTAPTKVLPLDTHDLWFVLEARVLKIVSGEPPEGWGETLKFGVHSPALYFVSQGIEPSEERYVPTGRFLFTLRQSSTPPWVLELKPLQ